MAQAFAKEKLKGQNNQRPHVYNQAIENSLSHPPLGYVVNSHHIHQWYRFSEEVKNYEPLIDGLEHAFSNSLFCCGGSFRTPDMDTFVLKVRPKDSAEDKESWRECLLANFPAEELLEYCNPAPFGDLKEMKTVLNTEVRSAYEIETARFKVLRGSGEIKDVPGSASIYKHIAEELTPGRHFKMDQNKLNIYGKGGFFKPHVDSPSSDSMIGTLVICLPSPHKGGELVVNHDGWRHVFDFSEHAADTSRVQWAAFYSDCIHEVKPVVEGHRVTVTYNITLSTFGSLKERYFEQWDRGTSRDKPVDANEHFEASARSPTRSLTKVDRALRNIRHLQGENPPSRVGFLLKHKYTITGLQPQLLKGEDKELFDYLNAHQWKCMLKSVLSRFQTTMVPINIEDMDYEETHEIYEFRPSNSMSFPRNASPLTSAMHRAFQGITIRDLRQWRVGIPFIEIYRKPDDTKLLRNNEGSQSWVGNEIHDVDVDKIYLDSAAIVELSGQL